MWKDRLSYPHVDPRASRNEALSASPLLKSTGAPLNGEQECQPSFHIRRRSLDLKQIWHSALRDLQTQTVRTDYDTWLKTTSLVALNGDLVVLGAPNVSAKQMV